MRLEAAGSYLLHTLPWCTELLGKKIAHEILISVKKQHLLVLMFPRTYMLIKLCSQGLGPSGFKQIDL